MAVDDLVAGRAIEQLLQGSRRRGWRHSTPIVAPAKEWRVAELLGITLEEVRRLRANYRGREWTLDQAAKAFAKWHREHGRFPTYYDLHPANRLPTITMLQRAAGSSYPVYWERYVARETCIRATWEKGFLRPEEVLKIRNITWRRQAIDHYGIATVLANGTKIDEDPEHGILWRIPVLEANTGDRHSVFLEVVNNTPEPDGSYAHYFLRVPPNMLYAKQARAWTFGIEAGWQNFEIGMAT